MDGATINERVTSVLEDTIFEFAQEKNLKKLNLLGIQLKPLHLCGILPPVSISASPCKSFIYNIFTALVLFWFIPHITTQIMAMFEHRNKFEMVTALIFQIALFIHTGTVAAYFVFHRKHLNKLLELLETNFVPHIEKIGSPIKYKSIIKKDSKQASLLIWTLLGVCWLVLFAWGFLPMIVRYYDLWMSEDQGIDESLDSRDEFLKYFGLIMWLPQNVDKFPVYELVYMFDSIAAYVVDSNLTGSNTIFFIFMFNTATHFKILTSCIEGIDEIYPKPFITGELDNDLTTGSKKSGSRTILTGSIISHEGEVFGPLVPDGVDEYSNERITGTQMNHQYFNKDFHGTVSDDDNEIHTKGTNIRTNQRIVQISQSRIKENLEDQQLNKEQEEKVYQYLVDCIKFHQALLEFCYEVDKFLSPVLLVFFLGSEAMVCFSAFQLALGLSDGNFKFFTSVVDTIAWPLMICWYGEYLSEQSLAVKYAAFNCQWYNHSTRIKKLLQMIIMRAQYPVRLTVGKFYVVSLETFADIGNKVYAFFTILRHMLE